MTTPPVLLLGSGESALGALRALASVGVRCYVLAEQPGFVARSRWYHAAPGTAAAADADFAGYLDSTPWPRAVLLPCSDHWAWRVSELPAATLQRFPASVPGADALFAMVDKGRFESLLAEVNVDRPVTLRLDRPSDLNTLPDAVLASGFLKPRDSQSFFARYGVKAFRVRDRADALRQAQAIIEAGFALMFQEYVPGPARNHVFVDGFRDRGGDVRARFARRRGRMYPLDFGNSSYQVSIPIADVAPAVAQLERLLDRVRYRGVFSAEFKQDPRDGRFKILEVNCRVWWYVEFAARSGVNVCDLAYRDALSMPLSSYFLYRPGRRCVYPYFDFFACRALHRRGELSLWSWVKSWVGALQPVFRWSDPLPAVYAARRVLAGFVRRRLTRRPGS